MGEGGLVWSEIGPFLGIASWCEEAKKAEKQQTADEQKAAAAAEKRAKLAAAVKKKVAIQPKKRGPRGIGGQYNYHIYRALFITLFNKYDCSIYTYILNMKSYMLNISFCIISDQY